MLQSDGHNERRPCGMEYFASEATESISTEVGNSSHQDLLVGFDFGASESV